LNEKCRLTFCKKISFKLLVKQMKRKFSIEKFYTVLHNAIEG